MGKELDPARDNHYALSDDTALELTMLADAMDAISVAITVPDSDDGSEVGYKEFAPIFFVFSRYARRIIGEMPYYLPATGKTIRDTDPQ